MCRETLWVVDNCLGAGATKTDSSAFSSAAEWWALDDVSLCSSTTWIKTITQQETQLFILPLHISSFTLFVCCCASSLPVGTSSHILSSLSVIIIPPSLAPRQQHRGLENQTSGHLAFKVPVTSVFSLVLFISVNELWSCGGILR